MTDFAIAGGGLAGGLIALALHRADPELRIALVESGETLGGNHRWSWFDSDLDTRQAALFSRLRTSHWDTGYAVVFPSYDRRLSTGYNSLTSEDFDAGLARELPDGTIRTGAQVAALDADGIELEDGERIAARAVIDCRGAVPTPHLTGGWQVFMGRHLRTHEPHGIECPVIFDCDVEQPGACRFVYTLPLGADELFVEDTYYQDDPVLDRSALSSRIDAYCAEMGWEHDILGGETGVLPVVTGGDFDAHRAAVAVDGVTLAGARGGFTHPLTSYTLPFAARTALEIADNRDLTGPMLAARMRAAADRHWRDTNFYRRLGRMMFGAARPQKRYKVFEHTYRLDEDLIERFYAARPTAGDKARLLSGKPPVPIAAAMRALASSGRPLIAPSPA